MIWPWLQPSRAVTKSGAVPWIGETCGSDQQHGSGNNGETQHQVHGHSGANGPHGLAACRAVFCSDGALQELEERKTDMDEDADHHQPQRGHDDQRLQGTGQYEQNFGFEAEFLHRDFERKDGGVKRFHELVFFNK